MTYATVWSGSLETAAIKAQQKPAPPLVTPRPDTAASKVLAHLGRYGESTVNEIAAAYELPRGTAVSAIGRLMVTDDIEHGTRRVPSDRKGKVAFMSYRLVR